MIPFIALVDEGAAFDPTLHARNDIGKPSRLSILCGDGRLPLASFDVRNPHVPLSSLPGKRIFISNGRDLLFSGRLSNVPRGLVNSVLTVEAIARPDDLDDQISAVVEAHKKAPFYDVLCLPEGSEDAPEEVFSGYSKTLVYSRLGVVSAVDALSGSTDISIMPGKDTVRYDVISAPYEFGVSLSVSWQQLGLQQHYYESPKFFKITTMTPDDLSKNFPKVGSFIGAGWAVVEADASEALDAFGASDRESVSVEVPVSSDELDPVFIEAGTTVYRAEIAPMDLKLGLEYRYEVNRSETCELTIPVGIQEGVSGDNSSIEYIGLRDITEVSDEAAWQPQTDYEEEDRIVDADKVYEARSDHFSGAARDPQFWIEVGEVSYLSSRRVSSFFKSDRGLAVIAHCIALR
jgi:hypothetical protein